MCPECKKREEYYRAFDKTLDLLRETIRKQEHEIVRLKQKLMIAESKT